MKHSLSLLAVAALTVTTSVTAQETYWIANRASMDIMEVSPWGSIRDRIDVKRRIRAGLDLARGLGIMRRRLRLGQEMAQIAGQHEKRPARHRRQRIDRRRHVADRGPPDHQRHHRHPGMQRVQKRQLRLDPVLHVMRRVQYPRQPGRDQPVARGCVDARRHARQGISRLRGQGDPVERVPMRR